MAHPPLLIALPQGLLLGGVTTFAARLANGLAARARHTTIIAHPEPPGAPTAPITLDPRVELIRPGGDGRFQDSPGDLSWCTPTYRDVVRRLSAQSGSPVVIAPQGLGDGYGVAAALATTDPELLRTLAWQHSDIEYDTRVLDRYEPIIARFIAVSDHIHHTLASRLPSRTRDILNIPYGVECSGAPDPRAPRPTGHPLRLIYTGRLDHEQKRILALPIMSAALDRRGIAHRLTIVGDGPASAALDAAIAAHPSIQRLRAVPPDQVAALLRAHDALVLPSRYEGLSISMLEAMAAGCVPIVAQTRSGALQAIDPGCTGEIADVAPDADEEAAGPAMADAVQRFTERDRAAMSSAARRAAIDRFSIDRHLDRVLAAIDAAAHEPPRHWPADRPCAFTASSPSAAGSGSVPPDGPGRLRAALERLRDRKVILHGAGQHTLQLASILASSPADIVALADDDRARHGSRLLGWPIVDPRDAARTGATDVLISTWMHHDAIWARRAVYELQGLRTHRLYDPRPSSPAPASSAASPALAASGLASP